MRQCLSKLRSIYAGIASRPVAERFDETIPKERFQGCVAVRLELLWAFALCRCHDLYKRIILLGCVSRPQQRSAMNPVLAHLAPKCTEQRRFVCQQLDRETLGERRWMDEHPLYFTAIYFTAKRGIRVALALHGICYRIWVMVEKVCVAAHSAYGATSIGCHARAQPDLTRNVPCP